MNTYIDTLPDGLLVNDDVNAYKYLRQIGGALRVARFVRFGS